MKIEDLIKERYEGRMKGLVGLHPISPDKAHEFAEMILEYGSVGFDQCGKHEHAYDTIAMYIYENPNIFTSRQGLVGLLSSFSPEIVQIETVVFAIKAGIGIGIELGKKMAEGQAILTSALAPSQEQSGESKTPPQSPEQTS